MLGSAPAYRLPLAMLSEEGNMDEHSRKYIAKYVEDMHSLVSHGLHPFAHQLSESALREHPEARRAIEQFHTTLQQHEVLLERRMQALGTSPTTVVQDTAAAVAGVVAGLYNQVRTEAVSRSLRDDYTFLSLCNISWLMLATTARALGDSETEELAEEGYRDTARMETEIDHLMPSLVVQELVQDHLPAQDVSEWARSFVHSAWTRETAAQPGERR
jgi:ferritin-like metal-binding protein YciE